MMKFTVAAALVAPMMSFAQEIEASQTEVQPEVEAEVELEEEEDSPLCFGVDVDFLAGYVWRHSVSSKEMVLQPSVWAELELFGPLTLSGFVWQNYDLTNRRHDTFRYFLTETDYNIALKYTAWEDEEDEESDEDERMKLSFEFGHEWYTYHGVKDDARNSNPDTREIYLKASFQNPLITPYAQVSWMYEDFGDYKRGVYYEVGLNKNVKLNDIFAVGADWAVGFGDKNYNDFLFGEAKKGFGGTTVKLFATAKLTDWASIKGTIGYTGVINGSMRNSIGDQGEDYDFYGSDYPRDLLWGGVSLNLEF